MNGTRSRGGSQVCERIFLAEHDSGPYRSARTLFRVLLLGIVVGGHSWVVGDARAEDRSEKERHGQPREAISDRSSGSPSPAASEDSAAGESAAGGEEVNITSRITTGNRLGLTVFNDGFVGTNLANRNPSMEYPLGSSIEHLVRAGVWVGGLNAVGDTLVSTATVAGSYGTRSLDSEFVPRSEIRELSLLPNSRYFSREARSEQDFNYSYADTLPFTREPENHNPLNVAIDIETLLFSFEPFDAIVIMNMKVINLHPTDPLFDVYVGVYTEFATGYKDPVEPNWQRGWFGQKDIGYVDSLRLVTEHHFTLDDGLAPSWAGLQLLGTRPTPIDELTTSFNWWNWDDEQNRTGLAPITDRQRWQTMSNGQIRGTAGSEAPNQDPVQLLSVGPIRILEAGDTVTVSWAWLGGEEDPRTGRDALQDLVFNAGWARSAFEANFNIPVPPPSPQLLVAPEHNRLVLRWTDLPEQFIDPRSGLMDFEGYRVYVSESRLESQFENIVEADIVDSIFYNTGISQYEDPVTIDGTDYKYRYDIPGVRDGFKYWTAVTAFDTGTPEIESLESGRSQNRTFTIPGPGPSSSDGGPEVVVFPNPYRGDAAWDGALGRDRYLWFANLPARCTIRIYTLSGDLVDTIQFDSDEYQPTDIRGIYDPTDVRNPEADLPRLSGGMAAWDLVSRSDQGIASGLYMFAVEDLDSGDKQIGKFLIMK